MQQAVIALLMLFAGLAGAAGNDARNAFAIGPWQPGMAREQALGFEANGPFTPGAAFNEYDAFAMFQGHTLPVTLGFDARGLKTLQLYRYQGRSASEAKAAALAVFDLFVQELGGASVQNVQPDGGKPLDHASLGEALDKILGTAQDMAERARRKDRSLLLITFDMIPNHQPAASRVHSQWGYSASTGTFYVHVFHDRIDAPLRRARSNLFLERVGQGSAH